MALTKTVTAQFTSQDIGEQSEYALSSITAVDLSAVLLVDVEAVVVYTAPGTIAAICRIYASSDNTNWTSVPVDQFTVSATVIAGQTIRLSKTVVPSMKYMKATIFNNQGASTYHITGSVNVTTQA
jgi:hypothetical protein